MFTFGFSYIGAIYLLMLFIPNIIWAKNQPKGYTAENENKILGLFERTGEALCSCCVLIFLNLIFVKQAGSSLMILYELYWIRYFKATPHKDCTTETQSDFSSDCTGISQAYYRMSRDFCVI